VDFYKGGEPLNDEERPRVEFVGTSGNRAKKFELMNLPSHIPVTRTVILSPGHNEYRRQRAVEEADRIEFVAVIEGAKDIRTRLYPWNELKDQTERC